MDGLSLQQVCIYCYMYIDVCIFTTVMYMLLYAYSCLHLYDRYVYVIICTSMVSQYNGYVCVMECVLL